MSVVAAPGVVAPDEFLAMPDRKSFELIDGELRQRTGSVLGSLIAVRLGGRLGTWVEAHNLGWVFSSGNGYQCFADSPNTVRKPALSFICIERLRIEEIGEGWAKVRPDLVVEVISPNDSSYEVEAKIDEYLRVGVPLIWVVYPPTRTVRVVRVDGTTSLLRGDAELSGENVVVGFTCRVADLFPAPVAPSPAPTLTS